MARTGAHLAAAAAGGGARGSVVVWEPLHGGKELRETQQLGAALHTAEVEGPELYLRLVAGQRARAW